LQGIIESFVDTVLLFLQEREREREREGERGREREREKTFNKLKISNRMSISEVVLMVDVLQLHTRPRSFF
jgi:hypothetical protein